MSASQIVFAHTTNELRQFFFVNVLQGDRNLLRNSQHTHTTALPLSPLPSPTFFIHTKENNRPPFDTKFFANLHGDHSRSKISKIPLKMVKNTDSSEQEENTDNV